MFPDDKDVILILLCFSFFNAFQFFNGTDFHPAHERNTFQPFLFMLKVPKGLDALIS